VNGAGQRPSNSIPAHTASSASMEISMIPAVLQQALRRDLQDFLVVPDPF
jgi:hypothetical protein